MVVVAAEINIFLPAACSLKDKRAVVRSLLDRLRTRFQVSAAEVGLAELHQRAELGLALVASDSNLAERLLDRCLRWLEEETEKLGAEVVETKTGFACSQLLWREWS